MAVAARTSIVASCSQNSVRNRINRTSTTHGMTLSPPSTNDQQSTLSTSPTTASRNHIDAKSEAPTVTRARSTPSAAEAQNTVSS
jgi:hypothetical protein